MKLKLTLKKPDQSIESIDIERFPFTIGRSLESDLMLDEPHISRHHARIEKRGKEIFLVKLSKRGPLIFDNHDIEAQPISLPATFEIPPYSFVCEPVTEERPAPLPVEEKEFTPLSIPETEVLVDAREAEIFPATLDDAIVPEETKIAKQRASAKIVVLKGICPHPSFDLIGNEITIGRDESCDIALDDPKASRAHAILFARDGHFFIKDAGSANGTFINERQIQADHKLSSGDQIHIGDSLLQFAWVDEDVYALSPSLEKLQSDATQTDLLSPSERPQWEPDIAVAYYPKKSFRTFLRRHRTIAWALFSLGALLVTFVVLSPPTPVRPPASQPAFTAVSTQAAPEKDELASLVKDDQKYVEAKMKEAKDLIKNRQYLETEVALQEIFAIVPNYKKARALQITVRQILDQQDVEKRRHLAGIEEKKLEEQIKYHLSVALDYFNRQQWEKAMGEYDKVIELQPDHAEAQQKKALIQQKLTESKQKQPTITRDKKAERLLAEGSRLSQQGNHQEALKIWRSVLNMEGIKPSTYAQADKFIQFAKDKLREKYLPLITQANALMESNNFGEAQRILESILNDYPSHVEAKEALQKVSNSLHQQARQEYTEAIIEENVGRIDAAIKKFKEIIDRIPASDPYHQKAKRKLEKYE